MDLSMYLERICSNFENVDLSNVELVTEGMQFVVVIADGWVFRFARNEWGVNSLANEAKILELLRSRVELQIPRYEYLESDFCAYRFLVGEALTFQVWQRLEPEVQARTMRQLGLFLQALHGTPLDGHDLALSGAARSREDWLRFYAEIETELFPKMLRFQRDWVKALFVPILENRLSFEHTPTLVDGDISVYHLLFDPQRLELTAKIDFGIAGIGDPAVDLACILINYGEQGTKHVLEVYPQSQDFLERARFWAGTLELQWVYYGLKRNPEDLLLAHLATARDLRLPV